MQEALTAQGISDYDCDRSYLDTVLRWPCYGSMLYEVEQTYTSAVARNLWFAVNADGVSLIARGEKARLVTSVDRRNRSCHTRMKTL